MAIALARLGAPAEEHDALARSLPGWEPFPEVPAALEEARSRGWRLAILSNTDRDLIDASSRGSACRSTRRSSPPRSARTSRRPRTGRSSSPARAPTAQRARPRRARASSTTSRRRRSSGCAPSGSTGSARRPSRSRTSSCRLSTGSATRSTRSCRMNVRPATKSDYAAIAELFARDEARCFRRPTDLTADVVDGWLADRRSRDEHVAVRGGRDSSWPARSDKSTATAGTAPAPSGRRRGAAGSAAELVELLEERIARGGRRADPQQHACGATPRATELLESRGYGEVRRFWDMAIEFDGDASRAGGRGRGVPGGRRARIPRRARGGVRGALGATSRSRSRSGGSDSASAHDFDPSVWFVIRDGDEIAAVCRNDAHEARGYVGALGVRPAWRGRGYGARSCSTASASSSGAALPRVDARRRRHERDGRDAPLRKRRHARRDGA